MIRRVSLGLALTASILGGFAGVHAVSKDVVAPAAKSAAIQCGISWDITDPAAKQSITRSNRLLIRGSGASTRGAAAEILHAHISTPYAILPAKKTCIGGDPLDLSWETWNGDKHLDNLWFLNSTTDEAVFASTDPLGLRTWKGTSNPPDANILFTSPQSIDVRLKTDLDVISRNHAVVPWKYQVKVVKYSVTLNADVTHPNIGVTLQYRCFPSETWLYYGRANSDANGLFSFAINEATQCPAVGDQLQVQGVIHDTVDTWGWTQWIES
ncbi:hypothetical protein [Kribbella sp. NPDC003557]|uniref:hypothetical protein n=1 Tax=Kribbella sp. NPDC003557 TaxID=3154449 RepID=UPI00339EF485